jgi:hypothetical protein
MDLLELEIERHRWAEISCACGPSAAHLANDLRRLARAESRAEFNIDLGNHVYLASCLWECAPAATAVALAGLAGRQSTAPGGRLCPDKPHECFLVRR